MSNKKYNPFVDTYNFNANSSNWVQRLGHNADFYNNPLGYNSSPTPRPYDNTTASGINNSFNINNRQPSSSGLESYNQPQKQQYTNPKVKPFTSWDIALSALEGFGEGIENGSLALLNAYTGGLYDILNYALMGDDYAKRQEKMQKQAESVGLGFANKLANFVIDKSGKYTLGDKGLKYINKFMKKFY